MMSINVVTMAVRRQRRYGRGFQLVVAFYSPPSGCSKGIPIQFHHRRRYAQQTYQGNYLYDNKKYALNCLVDAPSRAWDLEETRACQYRSFPGYCIWVRNGWLNVVGVIVDAQ